MVIDRLIRTSVVMLTTLALLAPGSAWAALRAYVDRNPVGEDEGFTLTLESDKDLDGSPDLGPLRRDFDIQEQGRSSSLSIINGAVSHKIQWRISLMARHSGRLTIPSIRVGAEQSQPLTLVVTAANPASGAATGRGDLFMDVTLAPKSVYVQQQAVYTVRLYHAVNLGNGSTLSEPEFPGGDAVVEKLGKDKEFETVRNGLRYGVLERRYAIYPQKSGDIDIPAQVFDGRIVRGGGGFFAFDPFNQRTVRKRVRSQALHLDVRAVPRAFHGAQWLPASALKLDERWAPDPPRFTVGQAVTRTLRIEADGLTSSQLPALTDGAPIDGIKQYPDRPTLKDTPDGTGLRGSRSEKIAYIPQRAGRLVLPAIAVPWWNTKTDRQEVARLPERTITIVPASGGTAQTPVPVTTNPVPVPEVKAPAAAAPAGTPITSAPRPAVVPAAGQWPWIALLLGLGWFTTAAVWWWRSRAARSGPAPAPEAAAPSRALERAIRESCRANDAPAARATILAWAGHRWPERPPLSLTAVARRVPDAFAAELAALDRVLYAPAATPWNGEALWRRFVESAMSVSEPRKTRTTGLEPLYPVP